MSEARAARAEEYRRSRTAVAIRKQQQQAAQQTQQEVGRADDVPQVAISIKADVQGSAEALSSAVQVGPTQASLVPACLHAAACLW